MLRSGTAASIAAAIAGKPGRWASSQSGAGLPVIEADRPVLPGGAVPARHPVDPVGDGGVIGDGRRLGEEPGDVAGAYAAASCRSLAFPQANDCTCLCRNPSASLVGVPT